jgi:hypothetical protein
MTNDANRIFSICANKGSICNAQLCVVLYYVYNSRYLLYEAVASFHELIRVRICQELAPTRYSCNEGNKLPRYLVPRIRCTAILTSTVNSSEYPSIKHREICFVRPWSGKANGVCSVLVSATLQWRRNDWLRSAVHCDLSVYEALYVRSQLLNAS